MKKLSMVILMAISSHLTIAQKYLPIISANTVINYNAMATNVGQTVQLKLTVVSLTDPVTLGWQIPGFGQGTYQFTAAGFESGTKMKIKEPADGVTKLKDDETIMVISKKSFAGLVKDQTMVFNGATFTVKPLTAPYKINDLEADVVHAVSANGKVEIWVLNNPEFPLLCKLSGNPGGIDLDLANIKETEH
jgi:hypothetical protein